MSSVPEAEIVQLLFSFCIYILYSVHDFSSLEERTHYSEPRDNGSGPARYKTQTSLQVCTLQYMFTILTLFKSRIRQIIEFYTGMDCIRWD